MSIDSYENIRTFVRCDIPLMAEMLEKSLISSVNVRDSSCANFTALMYQVRYGTVEGMEFLMASKPPALVNLQASNGYTALHYAMMYAVRSRDPAKLRFLLDNGADKTIRTNGGETALEYARRNKCPKECIEVLKSYTPKLRG